MTSMLGMAYICMNMNLVYNPVNRISRLGDDKCMDSKAQRRHSVQIRSLSLISIQYTSGQSAKANKSGTG